METPSFLIIRLSAIGDIILTTPLIRQLRAAYPHSKIDFLTKPAFKSLLVNSPHLDHVYTLDQYIQASYDYVIDLQNNFKSRKLSAGLSHKTYQYRKENWRKFLLVHFKFNVLKECFPVAERYKKELKDLNIKDDDKGCELFLSDQDRGFASENLSTEFKYLAVCFGATHFTKRYPLERFISVLKLILVENNINLVLLGGKDEKCAASEIMQALDNPLRVHDYTGKTSLMQSAALLQTCDCILTNDTGLMHMASSFEKNIVAIFGSSVQAFGFAPYRTPAMIMEVDGLKCRPCSHIGRSKCPKKHFKCMLDIQPTQVVSAVKKCLKH
jgi:heptosyltransferase-2